MYNAQRGHTVDINDIQNREVFTVFACLVSLIFGLCGSSITSVNIWLKVPIEGNLKGSEKVIDGIPR